MKTLKESVEGFPAKKYANAIQYVFDLDYFIQNATEIVNDFKAYGSCVLSDKDKAYGLMFKDTRADDNDIYMKAHVYPNWPQFGAIYGGVSFWTGSKNFGEELKKAINQL